MMGVPFIGPHYIYGDNMYVIHITQRLESTLKKKNDFILYHAMWESIAMGGFLTYHIPNHFNLSGMVTKTLFGK